MKECRYSSMHINLSWSLRVTICTTKFNFREFYFLPLQYIYVFFVWISGKKKTTIISLYNINRLAFYSRDGVCLLRGTNWVFKWYRSSFVLKGLIYVWTKSFYMNFTSTLLYTFYMFYPCHFSVTSVTALGSYFECCGGGRGRNLGPFRA